MSKVVSLHRAPEPLRAFEEFMGGKDPKTTRAYMAVLNDLVSWLATKPGGIPFRVEALTETAIKGYMDYLEGIGRAPRTRSKALSAIRRFCRWSQDEGLLRRNPASQVERPTVAQMAPRELSEDQRYALKNVIERAESARLSAIFALGYWAGLRISEVATLRVKDVDVNQRAGSLTIYDSKGGKTRSIDLANEARRALYQYLRENDGAGDARDPDSEYVFTSQRAGWLRSQGKTDNLSDRGIEHLWRGEPDRKNGGWRGGLRSIATADEWTLIEPITFHDLRHDFSHRARAAGWTLEEIAVYVGHQTRDGAPAINTTVRYTLPSRQQLKDRLQVLRG